MWSECAAPAAAAASAAALSPARWTHKLQSIIFAIELPSALLVDLVLWTILVPAAYQIAKTPCTAAAAAAAPTINHTIVECTELKIEAFEVGEFESWTNYTVHGVNGLLMLTELLLNRLPIKTGSIAFVTWWALLYAGFSCEFVIFRSPFLPSHPQSAAACADLVYFPFTHTWVYFFMNTATMLVVPWITALTLIHWLFFGMAYAASGCKERVVRPWHSSPSLGEGTRVLMPSCQQSDSTTADCAGWLRYPRVQVAEQSSGPAHPRPPVMKVGARRLWQREIGGGRMGGGGRGQEESARAEDPGGWVGWGRCAAVLDPNHLQCQMYLKQNGVSTCRYIEYMAEHCL